MVSSSFNQTQKHLEEYPTIDSKSYDRYDLEIKDVFSDRIETQEELKWAHFSNCFSASSF